MGKESVWDYPRPAICEPFKRLVKVLVNEIELAQSSRAYRVVETSLSPSY